MLHEHTVYDKTFEEKTYAVFRDFRLTVKVFPRMICSIMHAHYHLG